MQDGFRTLGATAFQSSETAFRGRICHFSEADLSDKCHIPPVCLLKSAESRQTVSEKCWILPRNREIVD